ncbi:MAG TPA: hypothetical protein VIV58_15495 [Kofleriaceae bacterium]
MDCARFGRREPCGLHRSRKESRAAIDVQKECLPACKRGVEAFADHGDRRVAQLARDLEAEHRITEPLARFQRALETVPNLARRVIDGCVVGDLAVDPGEQLVVGHRAHITRHGRVVGQEIPPVAVVRIPLEDLLDDRASAIAAAAHVIPFIW